MGQTQTHLYDRTPSRSLRQESLSILYARYPKAKNTTLCNSDRKFDEPV